MPYLTRRSLSRFNHNRFYRRRQNKAVAAACADAEPSSRGTQFCKVSRTHSFVRLRFVTQQTLLGHTTSQPGRRSTVFESFGTIASCEMIRSNKSCCAVYTWKAFDPAIPAGCRTPAARPDYCSLLDYVSCRSLHRFLRCE